MLNYNKSKSMLEDMEVETSSLVKLDKKEDIDNLELILYSGHDLPEDIELKEVSKTLIEDSSKYDGINPLPKFVLKEKFEITDKKQIDEIIEYIKMNLKYPENIISGYPHGEEFGKKTYYYSNKFNYYLKKYEFYKRIYTSNEEIDFQLKVINAKSLKSISASLYYFKVLSIISLICAIIYAIVLFSL